MQYACMETRGPTPGLPAATAAANPARTTPALQAGQLLQATVTSSDAGKVLLSVGHRQFSAETSLPLKTGQQLTLQVRALGELPVLQVIDRLSAPSLEQAALRTLLPRQAPLAPLLASLARLAGTPADPLPARLGELVRSVVRQMPEQRSVSTPRGLKLAIQDSGLFLESNLARAAAEQGVRVAQTDFKRQLLQLVQALRGWQGGQASGSPQGVRAASQAPGNAPYSPAAPGTTGTSSPGSPSPPPATTSSPAASNGGEATSSVRPPSSELPGRVLNTPTPQAARMLAGDSGTPGSSGQASAANRAGIAPTAGQPATNLPATLPFRGSIPRPQPVRVTDPELFRQLSSLGRMLLQQSEAALARLQLQQLASMPREGERAAPEWLFDLPVRRGENIDLWSWRVFRDGNGQAAEAQRQAGWSVQLAFDLPGLGPVQAQVRLDGEAVSTQFRTRDASTVPLFEAHLHELHLALTRAGLEVGELQCLPGEFPDNGAHPPENVLSEKA